MLFKLCYLAEGFEANFLEGKKHRVVQTVSSMSRSFVYSDRILSKKENVKGTVNISNFAKFKKNSSKETRENLRLILLIFALLTS